MSTGFGRTSHPPASLADRLDSGPVVLDGGLATLLEAHGHDLSSALWSARLLADTPEAITAAQGVDFRAPLKTGIELIKAHAATREIVPALEVDRYMADDLKAAAELVMSGGLNASVSNGTLPELMT